MQCFLQKMADKLNMHGVAAPRLYSKLLCLILMFILSHVLGNKLFYVSVVLVNQIRVILPQISFELHVHVVCSPFLLRAYFIKAFKT